MICPGRLADCGRQVITRHVPVTTWLSHRRGWGRRPAWGGPARSPSRPGTA